MPDDNSQNCENNEEPSQGVENPERLLLLPTFMGRITDVGYDRNKFFDPNFFEDDFFS